MLDSEWDRCFGHRSVSFHLPSSNGVYDEYDLEFRKTNLSTCR